MHSTLPYSTLTQVGPPGPSPTGNMRVGDWMCRACGNHNYADKLKCNRCARLRANPPAPALPSDPSPRPNPSPSPQPQPQHPTLTPHTTPFPLPH